MPNLLRRLRHRSSTCGFVTGSLFGVWLGESVIDENLFGEVGNAGTFTQIAEYLYHAVCDEGVLFYKNGKKRALYETNDEKRICCFFSGSNVFGLYSKHEHFGNRCI